MLPFYHNFDLLFESPPRRFHTGSAARSVGGASFPAPPTVWPRPGAARGSMSRVASASEQSAKPTRSALDIETRHRKLRGTQLLVKTNQSLTPYQRSHRPQPSPNLINRQRI